MSTEDKFYKFNGGFIKVSFIRQMSALIVWADQNVGFGYLNGEKYERYLAGIDRVPYLDRPEGLLKHIYRDPFCKDYLSLYKAFLEYNNLESELICFDCTYDESRFIDEDDED